MEIGVSSFNVTWKNPFFWDRFIDDWYSNADSGDFRFLLGPPDENGVQEGILLIKYIPRYEEAKLKNFTWINSMSFDVLTKRFRVSAGSGVASIVWQETGSGDDLTARAREDISRLSAELDRFRNTPCCIQVMGDFCPPTPTGGDSQSQ